MKYPRHSLPNFHYYSKLAIFVTDMQVPSPLRTISLDPKFQLVFFVFFFFFLILSSLQGGNRNAQKKKNHP